MDVKKMTKELLNIGAKKNNFYCVAKHIWEKAIDEEGDVEDENSLPLHLAAFILNNSRRARHNYTPSFDGYKMTKYFTQILIHLI